MPVNVSKTEQIGTPTDQVNRPMTYIEVLVRWTRLPWWLVWIGVLIALYLVDHSLSIKILGVHTLQKPLAAWLLFSMACSINVVWASHQLCNSASILQKFIEIPKKDFKEWYGERLQWGFRSGWAFSITIAVMLLVSLSAFFIIFRFSEGKFHLAIIRSALLTVSSLGPCCLWATVLGTCILGHKIAKLPIKVPVYQDPKISIKALGSLFFRVMMATVVCYALALFGLIVSPVAKDSIVFIWVGATGVAILLGFILPQVGVHRVMVGAKLEKLRIVSHYIEMYIERTLSNPSPKNLTYLKDLCEIRQRFNEMDEWPFSLKEFWQLTTATFIPLLLHFTKAIWN